MPSSVINRIDYDAKAERLVVTFVSGKIYSYAKVPETEYEAFRDARSKGRFFNARIRDRYPARQITARSGSAPRSSA